MNKNMLALTSVRGVAALVVLFYHLNQTFESSHLFFYEIFQHGYLGVDLFFVLSGFIMAYVYGRKSVSHQFMGFYKKFILTRLARVYPLHLVTLAATLLLVLVLPGFRESYPQFFTKTSFILNLFLIQNWGFVGISWNTASWSISAEWFMYLLFPIMLFINQKFNISSKRWALFLFAAMVLSAHYLIIFILGWRDYGGMSAGGMVRVFFEFSLGFLLFFLRDTLKPKSAFVLGKLSKRSVG
ncbi:MAG: acyltransferase [Pseudomonadota bacterium]